MQAVVSARALVPVSIALTLLLVGCSEQHRAGRFAKEGHALVSKGQFDLAARKFTEAIQTANTQDIVDRADITMAHRGRGWCYMKMQQYDAAVADFEEAIRLAGSVRKDAPGLFDDALSGLEEDRAAAIQERSLRTGRR